MKWRTLTVLVIGIIVALTWRHFSQSHLSGRVHWHSATPIQSRHPIAAIKWGSVEPIHSRSVAVPSQQLSTADWYLPITSFSSLGYVLHDGKARWVVHHHAINLAQNPTNPVGTVATSPTGTGLAWDRSAHTIELLTWPQLTPKNITHATSPSFLPNGQLEYVSLQSTHPVVVTPQHHWSLPSSQWGQTPFVQVKGQSSFVYDTNGTIHLLSLTTGRSIALFSVNSQHWTHLSSTVASSSTLALLFVQPQSLSRYLLVIMDGTKFRWYRWQSPLAPELGITRNGQVAISEIDSNSRLTVTHGIALHRTSLVPGWFSTGRYGITWDTAKGFRTF